MSLRVIRNSEGVIPSSDIVYIPSLSRVEPVYRDGAYEVWLRDAICPRFPHSRVLAFVHKFGSDFPERGVFDWTQLLAQGEGLLFALVHDRETVGQSVPREQSPIIFLCHTFGGFILKKALLYAASSTNASLHKIYEYTSGIVFLGTLHNGQHDSFGKALARCAAVESGLSLRRCKGINDLANEEPTRALFADLCASFESLPLDFRTITIIGSRATRYPSKHRWRPMRSALLGSQALSASKIAGHTFQSIPIDHIQLSATPSIKNPYFETLAGSLASCIENSLRQPALPAQVPGRLSSEPPKRFDGFHENFHDLIQLDLSPQNQLNSTLPVATTRRSRNTSPSLERPSSKLSNYPTPPPTPQELPPPTSNTNFQAESSYDSHKFIQSPPIISETSSLANGFGFTTSPLPEVHLPCRTLGPYLKNPDFVGRTDTLNIIKAQLLPNSTKLSNASLAICGLGGLGKTQVALKFALSNDSKFEAILWALAEDEVKLANSFANFALALKLIEHIGPDLKACRELLKKWFETTKEPWLVIFDNVEDANILDEFWPAGSSGSIIVTSRAKAVAGVVDRTIFLEPLSSTEAVDLILKLTKFSFVSNDNSTALDTIVDRVDCLPLALTAVANVIRNNDLTPSEYLEAYDNEKLIKGASTENVRRPQARYEHSLATVWDLEFKVLDEDARHLLAIMAFYDADSIQQALIINGAAKVKTSDLQFLATQPKFIRCKAKLLRSSLVSRGKDNIQSDSANINETLQMHRLVKATCHLRMKAHERQQAFHSAVQLLLTMWPVAPRHARYDPLLWPTQQSYLPHVRSLCEYYASSQETDSTMPPLSCSLKFAELLYNAAWYMYERGTYLTSWTLIRTAQGICNSHADKADVLLSELYHLEGSIASESNQGREAFEKFSKAYSFLVSAAEKGLIENDLRQAGILGSIGHGYQCINRFAEAEPYYHKCLAKWKEMNSNVQPVTWELGLALCYQLQGKLQDAKTAIKRIIDEREKRFGSRDTKSSMTAGAYNILGNILIMENDMQAAYETHVIALDLANRTWGDRHHRSADICHKVAWHLYQHKDLQNSIKLYRHALAVYRESYLCEHEIVRTSYQLSKVLIDAGQLDEGQSLQESAENGRKKVLGEGWLHAVSDADYDNLVMFWSR